MAKITEEQLGDAILSFLEGMGTNKSGTALIGESGKNAAVLSLFPDMRNIKRKIETENDLKKLAITSLFLDVVNHSNNHQKDLEEMTQEMKSIVEYVTEKRDGDNCRRIPVECNSREESEFMSKVVQEAVKKAKEEWKKK